MSEGKQVSTSEKAILVYFWRACLKHKRTLLISLYMPLGTLGLSTLLPFYTGKLLAALSTDIHHASRFLPFVFASGIVGALVNRIGSASLFENQARVISDLQELCLRTLLKQSASFHSNRVAGKLVSDALDFPQSYALLAGTILTNIIPLSITIVVGIVLVATKSWLLGLILFGMATVTIGATLWHSKRRKPLRTRRLVATKAVTGHLADTIVNNQTVKIFAHETHELDTHHKLNKVLLGLRISDWRGGAAAGNNRILGLLCFQLLFAAAVIHVVATDHSLLAVGIFAFSYSTMLSNNLFSINSWIRQIEDAFLQAEPFMEILQHEPDIQDVPGSTELQATRGIIHFNDVTFHYEDATAEASVFDRLELAIKPGEKIGLVGPSGGGKSTLTRLLLRFNDIQGGEITIDNQNIAKVTQTSLRHAIAYVPQEPLLFHRSVVENIAYGNLDADPESVIAAAKQARAHEFIEKLPQGYETLVGERGVKLSGGQRQRIAIARAILKNAPILVLDEATSALDSESELYIQEALKELMKGRTTLVVAHRLSTIQNMDRIVVLEEGAITEQGTHAQLLRKKGTYAKLWKHQSGGFLED